MNLFLDDDSLKKSPNLVHIVNLLLDNFRQCQKMDFKPDVFLVQSLEEAGFEKQKVLEALKITGNNHENAVSRHNNCFFTMYLFIYFLFIDENIFSVPGYLAKGGLVYRTYMTVWILKVQFMKQS